MISKSDWNEGGEFNIPMHRAKVSYWLVEVCAITGDINWVEYKQNQKGSFAPIDNSRHSARAVFSEQEILHDSTQRKNLSNIISSKLEHEYAESETPIHCVVNFSDFPSGTTTQLALNQVVMQTQLRLNYNRLRGDNITMSGVMINSDMEQQQINKLLGQAFQKSKSL